MVEAPTKPKYEIQGDPLIKIKYEIFQLGNFPSKPNVTRLTQDAFRLVNERFQGYKDVELDISSLKENRAVGYSNPYRRWAVGPAVGDLAGIEFQLLTPALSELALKYGTLPDARNTYEDLAVVVYSLKGPNGELAQHLVDQARERGIKVKFPLVIYGLKTVKDDKFPDGLRFDLGDAAVAYHVPILSKDWENFDANDPELVKTGFPSKLGSGTRILYTANDGLRGVSRGSLLDLDAGYGHMHDSVEAGRVSFVKGAAPQNLEASIEAIEAENRRQEKAVEAWFSEAMKKLKFFQA